MNIKLKTLKTAERTRVTRMEYTSAENNYGWTESKVKECYDADVAHVESWNRVCRYAKGFDAEPTLQQVAAVNVFAIDNNIMPFEFWGQQSKHEYWGGSCQYETIGQVFYSRINLKHLPWEDWQEVFGVTATWTYVVVNARSTVMELIEEQIEEQQEYYDDHMNGLMDGSTSQKDVDYHKKGLDEAKAQKVKYEAMDEIRLQEGFQIAMDLAWDLWSALPSLLGQVKDLEIEMGVKSPTFGPVFNMMAQSENYELGVMAVVLLETGLITEDEAGAWGFDT